MENKTDSKPNGAKVALIGAAITALAGIITSIVTMTGPIIDRQMAIQTTQTREAVVAGMQIQGAKPKQTDTPMPVNLATPAGVPTQTETPAATLAVDSGSDAQPQATDDAALLKVGESVSNKGMTVTLTQVEYPAWNEAHLHFTFTNTTNKVIKVSVNHNRDVTMTSDNGTVYSWASDFSWEVSILPGTSRNDEIKRRGDISKANYFIIKLDVPGLVSAQWKN